MAQHESDCMCGVCSLRRLDEGTTWELPREVQPDGDEDSSLATLPSNLHPEIEDAWGTSIPNIIDCLKGMYEKGEVQDVVVVTSTKDEGMLIWTNLERNDMIIGRLELAKMNWYSNELIFLEEEEGGE